MGDMFAYFPVQTRTVLCAHDTIIKSHFVAS